MAICMHSILRPELAPNSHTIASLDLPEHKTHEDDKVTVTTKYFPLGVVAGIIPWNFPLVLGSAKFASALLTGNTIILKPR